MTNKPASPQPEPSDSTDPAETGAPADVREQMRQALERKHGRAGESHANASGSKASAATTNQTVHREFRRKSGS